MKKKKLLFLVNYLSFFLSHRLPIAEASLAKGFDVYIGYGDCRGVDPKLLEKRGFKLNFIPLQPGGFNFFQELKTIYHIWDYFKKVKPDIVHLVTIKPYLYGGILSRFANIPNVVSAISGLGSLFINKSLKSRIILLIFYPFFKIAFNHKNQKIIIQNKDDLKTLMNWGVLDGSKVKLIKGSGVKIKNFTKLEEPKGVITICFAARLIKDKGVFEFITAAKLLKESGINARFILAGDLDSNNPSALSLKELNRLKDQDCVEFLGFSKDIPTLYSKSHIICLPSYREGFPKSLIEAAAASRVVVTTDVPGCRDAIVPNVTGILVPVKDFKKLSSVLKWLIENPEKRISMGKAGRRLAEKEFLVEKIVQNHLEIYDDLLSNQQ